MVGGLDFKRFSLGTSLVVQWLRLHTPNAGGPGSIPDQGTRSHMLQLRSGTVKSIQINFFLLKVQSVCSVENKLLGAEVKTD